MARFEKFLIKFVAVLGTPDETPRRDWLGMFNTEAEARACAAGVVGDAAHVEKWTYALDSDGAAGKPRKVAV